MNEITFENAFHIEGAQINVSESSCKGEEGEKKERKEGQERPDQTCVAGAY